MPDWEPIADESPVDPSGLRRKGITTRAELNAVEAQNVGKAVLKYLGQKPNRKSAPFTYGWSLQVHRDMFGDVWRWAGKPRLRDLSIGVPWATIPERLFNLLKDFQVWEGMDAVEKAARLHHGAVQIHPFENGNGRWSRLIANISMRLDGETWIEWPEQTIGTASVIRTEYIEAIKAADKGRIGPLLDICRRYESHV